MQLSPEERREVDVANKLVERSVTLARAIVSSGGHVLFENPPDRGDKESQDSMLRRLYQAEWENHAPLWLLRVMKAAKRDLNLREVTFPQCALGSKFQKYTTHGTHQRSRPFLTNSTYAIVDIRTVNLARGRDRARNWKSAEAAAYPAQMNAILAAAAGNAIDQSMSEYSPRVEEWFEVSNRGQLRQVTKEPAATTNLHGLTQVHVWTEEPLPHSKEESEWRMRHADESPPKVMWCGGDVVDFDFLRREHKHCQSAINLGDWAWAWNTTDRARAPVSIASADVFHIYGISLHVSYIFAPEHHHALS
jgi:hypothetical protein